MNIFFYLGSLNNGGAERVVVNICNKMSENHNMSIITTVPKKCVYEIDNRVKIYSLDNENETENIFKKNYKRIRKLKEIIELKKASVLVSFLSEPSFRSLVIKSKIKIPVIISQRNDPRQEYRSFVYKWLARVLYPHADGIVFQTEESKKYFTWLNLKKSVVIANPVADQFLCNEYKNPNNKTMIAVGRLDKQKNYEMLIKAFLEFSNEYPHYKLYIFGEGPQREYLEKLVKKLRCIDKVFMPGRVENIKQKLLEAEMYILSSDYEGMPNALIEAMTMGMPVIATDCPCGGPKELIYDSTMGQLVKVGDIEGMKKAMILYVENKKLRDVYSNNAKKVRNLVDPQLIINKWSEYIENVCNEYNAKR